jgi:hypothetical protein
LLHIQSSDIAWQVSRCSTRTHFICKKSQGKWDNSVSHLYSYQTLLGKSLDVVQEDILYVNFYKVRGTIQFVTDTVAKQCPMTVSVRNWINSLTLWLFTYTISFCTTSRDLPSVTRRNFICKKWQGKGENSVCHWYSHQTLLGKFLDVVQEEILYVKSDKVRYIDYILTFLHFTLPFVIKN